MGNLCAKQAYSGERIATGIISQQKTGQTQPLPNPAHIERPEETVPYRNQVRKISDTLVSTNHMRVLQIQTCLRQECSLQTTTSISSVPRRKFLLQSQASLTYSSTRKTVMLSFLIFKDDQDDHSPIPKASNPPAP